jgi:hypothetical protein
MILLGTMGLLIIALALLIISTKFGDSLYSWIAALFFVLAAWYARASSTVENDFYFVIFIISCFLILVAVITGVYIAYQDRKTNRRYKGEVITDDEIDSDMEANSEMIDNQRERMSKGRHKTKKKFNPLKWVKY